MLLCGLSASALASSGKVDSVIQINYGVVQNIQQTKLDSNVGKGAIVGGLIGAGTSGHHDRAQHAAEGAAALALLTAIAEGKRKAYAYEVKLNSGSIIKLVTESGDIAEGDCVSVEQGQSANIRRVSSVYCEEPDHEALKNPQVQAAAQNDAAECHTAKEISLAAKTENEVDIALKKVRVFAVTKIVEIITFQIFSFKKF